MGIRVVVVGAGGFGRGVIGWLRSSPRHLERLGVSEVVVVDDHAPEGPVRSSWVGKVADYEPAPGDEVLCAIANPDTRGALVDLLAGRGASFHTFVHDSAVLSPDVEVLPGSIVCPGVVISAGAKLAEQVHVNFNCSIGHDVVLSSLVTLSPAVNVMGETRLEARAFVGAGATILPRLQVGERALVGAGAVVVRSVAPDQTVVGVPARPFDSAS